MGERAARDRRRRPSDRTVQRLRALYRRPGRLVPEGASAGCAGRRDPGLVRDLFNIIGPTFGMKGDEQKAAREALMAKDGKFAYWFGKFEARLAENEARGNKNGVFVGDSITVADLKFYYSMGYLKSGNLDHIKPEDVAKGCDKINALLKAVSEDERIKKFDAAFAAQQAEAKEKGTLSFFVAANK